MAKYNNVWALLVDGLIVPIKNGTGTIDLLSLVGTKKEARKLMALAIQQYPDLEVEIINVTVQKI